MHTKNSVRTHPFLGSSFIRLNLQPGQTVQTTNADNKRSKMVKIRHEENEQHKC